MDTVCTSTTRLIANKDAWNDDAKRQKIQRIALLLKSVLAAESQVGLMMNVRKEDVDKVVGLLPALQKPTVSSLIDSDWVALNTVIEERVVRDFIPQLLEAGAHGIIEYQLNKLVE